MDLGADASELQSTKRAVIESLGPTSFTINGVRVVGSVLIMPHFSTLWNIDRFEQVCPDAFALVKLMHPRPDICIIGTGAELLVSLSDICSLWLNVGVSVINAFLFLMAFALQ